MWFYAGKYTKTRRSVNLNDDNVQYFTTLCRESWLRRNVEENLKFVRQNQPYIVRASCGRTSGVSVGT